MSVAVSQDEVLQQLAKEVERMRSLYGNNYRRILAGLRRLCLPDLVEDIGGEQQGDHVRLVAQVHGETVPFTEPCFPLPDDC